MTKNWDAIVIGGGFFGLSVAEYLKKQLGQKRVLVLEKEADLMQRASYNNQARVHNGYHYPRSLLTALRSKVNFPNFVKDYNAAIVNDFDKYYAIAHNFSKVSARQFDLFCQRIDADIAEAPAPIKDLFNKQLVEDVFAVKEFAFDSNVLKKTLANRLTTAGVNVRTGQEVDHVEAASDNQIVVCTKEGKRLQAKHVFNCAYSMINKINTASRLPRIGLKHELAELSLIKLPDALQNISVTVMCGPFFSFMPFPDKNLHTLSHVRYTPHSEWHDNATGKYKDGHDYLKRIKRVSHFPQMIADASRYLPALKASAYDSSLWEIKTVLPQSETDDSRPIFFKRHHGIPNYTCIMGGKLDNIYDAYKELDLLYA